MPSTFFFGTNNGKMIVKPISTGLTLNNDPYLIIFYTFESGTYTSTSLTNSAPNQTTDASFNATSSTQISSTLPIISGVSYLVINSNYIKRTVATTIGTNGFTFCFWFYYISGAGLFAQVGGSAASGPGIYLEIGANIIYINSNSGGYGPTESRSVSTSVNTWVHKAYTVTSGNLVSIYHNGALAASATGLQSYPFNNTAYGHGFYFGNGYTNNGGGYIPNGNLKANFDNIRVYSRALSASEISTLYSSSS
jgi:hypothetical protein